MNSHQRAKRRAAIMQEIQPTIEELQNLMELNVVIPPRVSNTLAGHIRRYNETIVDHNVELTQGRCRET